MSGTNWIDIIVLAIILIFAIKGLGSGLIREVFGIVGIVGGFVAAFKFKSEAGAWISANLYDLHKIGIMGGNGTETIVGFIAVLFGIWFIALIVGEFLAKLVGVSGLGLVDKLGGFFFGGAKIFLIFSIFAVFINSAAFLNEQAKPYFEKSAIYPYLLSSGTAVMGIKKEDIVKKIEEISDENRTDIVQESSEVNQNLDNFDSNSSDYYQNYGNIDENISIEGGENEQKN